MNTENRSIEFLSEIENMSSSSLSDVWGGGRMAGFTGCSNQDHVTSVTDVSVLEVW